MSSPRFLVPEIPASGPVVLASAEAKHASGVLRLKEGDLISVFDGCGGQAEGRITICQKREVVIELTSRQDKNVELPCRLEMLVALPKGDRQKVLVDGLVQLGVSRLVPLSTQRGVAQPSAGALERLSRSVIESSKQCGRNQLMEIAPPRGMGDLPSLVSGEENPRRLVAHPYGAAVRPLAEFTSAQRHPQRTMVAVGPEGGFTDDEVAAFDACGWSLVGLGPRILRIEMAAIMLASCLACASHS